jgi:ABC-type anion transport system duplicated permease subunit
VVNGCAFGETTMMVGIGVFAVVSGAIIWDCIKGDWLEAKIKRLDADIEESERASTVLFRMMMRGQESEWAERMLEVHATRRRRLVLQCNRLIIEHERWLHRRPWVERN